MKFLPDNYPIFVYYSPRNITTYTRCNGPNKKE